MRKGDGNLTEYCKHTRAKRLRRIVNKQGRKTVRAHIKAGRFDSVRVS